MATGTTNFDRRDDALEVVRQGLRQIEIETRRVKAHLARLEAEFNDAAADELSRTATCNESPSGEQRFGSPEAPPLVATNGAVAAVAELPLAQPARFDIAPKSRADRSTRARVSRVRGDLIAAPRADSVASSLPQLAVDSRGSATKERSGLRGMVKAYRRTTPPIAFSFAVHVVGLLLCLSFGFATLVQQAAPLFASPADLPEEEAIELAEVQIEPTKFEDAQLQNVLSETDEFNLADSLQHTVEAAELGAGSQPLEDIGQLDALPSDLGALMAGAGSPSRGRPGGDVGDAIFFGTRSVGNRFVFVVDNSSSMKGGRLEAAIAELLRTIDALSPRQAFYVIFVSDQTYPMYYPQPAADLVPATAPNKKRLAEWLPNAVLASGKNRELIKAMDLAASFRPDAVYLLWDGDMRYSDKVRTDVMTHLTRPQPWRFPIHTLGMGITSLDAEYNLTAIAQAHGGTYRRVDVAQARGR
jgi:hypothetical protein